MDNTLSLAAPPQFAPKQIAACVRKTVKNAPSPGKNGLAFAQKATQTPDEALLKQQAYRKRSRRDKNNSATVCTE